MRTGAAVLPALRSRAEGARRRVVGRLTASLRALPDWLIIGAQKAGTTSLCDYLVQHPDVRRAHRKEVHFFDNAFDRGELWYRSFFPLERERALHEAATGRRLLTGEATPYYLFHPGAPERAARTVPHARLIVLLRDPVERAYSHYMHQKVRGREHLSFEDALAAEASRLAGEHERLEADPRYRSRSHQEYSYFTRGLYAGQLQRWRQYYPEDQLLVIASEQLYSEPGRVMEQVFRFLGLGGLELPSFGVRNPGGYTGGPAAETVARLRAKYRQPNESLFALLGRDLGWNDAPRPRPGSYGGKE